MPRNLNGQLKFIRFVEDLTRAVYTTPRVGVPVTIRPLLAGLIAEDDWLPPEFCATNPNNYCQYLLYRDPSKKFSIVSFAWLAGQSTPVHDHTVWGAIGQLRGIECSTPFQHAESGGLRAGHTTFSRPGDVISFTPEHGDIHKVSNPGPETAVSVHVYGADIGTLPRSKYDEASGEATTFISGYTNSIAMLV